MLATYRRIVGNQSSREGGRPKLIVLHTTEGSDDAPTDLLSLASWFNNPSSQASAHVATDKEGYSVRMVDDEQKAWSVCSYNPYTLNIEQIGFSAFSRDDWFKRDKQLIATARFCAYWSKKYGIPLRHGLASRITLAIYKSGVVQHKNLGIVGCGHVDCGAGYPQRYVILMARLIKEEWAGKSTGRRAKRIRFILNRVRKRYGLLPLVAGTSGT